MANDAFASSVSNHSLPETTSSCLTRAITTAHKFEVIKFSLLEGMGIGKFVSSSTFSVGGCDWNIRLYPDGCSAEYKAYASAYLNPEGGQASSRVKFSLGIFEKDGHMVTQSVADHTFESGESTSFGWPDFVDKYSLRPLLRSNGDCFTIRCVLTVIKAPQIEDVRAITIPQSNLLPGAKLASKLPWCTAQGAYNNLENNTDFADMLKNGEGADVTFSVGNRLFPAHRCILAARSPVFKAELFGPMKEKAARHVRIDDMEPCIFEALLHFIYTDSLPDDDDDCDADRNVVPMQHLLVAADRYGLERLRLMCEAKICSSIDAETVATKLALAEQHHCVELKDACIEFIASRGVLGAVVESKGFDHLAASCPLVLLEISDKLDSLGV